MPFNNSDPLKLLILPDIPDPENCPARDRFGLRTSPFHALHYFRHPQLPPVNEEVIHCLLTLVRRGSPGAVKARW